MDTQRKRFTLGLVFAAAPILIAMPPAPSAGDRDHQDGALLRLWVGAGGARSELKATSSRFELSGTASEMTFAIGGVVSPNLALHCTLFGWMVNNPDAELDGQPASIQGDLDLTAVGGGLTYYVMPLNLYFSGTVGLGSLRLEHTPRGSSTSDVGLVTDATLGKEWWVGDQWGVGVATGFGYHSTPLKDSDGRWEGTSLTLRLSATMN